MEMLVNRFSNVLKFGVNKESQIFYLVPYFRLILLLQQLDSAVVNDSFRTCLISKDHKVFQNLSMFNPFQPVAHMLILFCPFLAFISSANMLSRLTESHTRPCVFILIELLYYKLGNIRLLWFINLICVQIRPLRRNTDFHLHC